MTDEQNPMESSEEVITLIRADNSVYTPATRSGLALRVTIMVVLLGMAAAIATFTFVSIFVFISFLFAALPYTVVATIFAVKNRRKAVKTVTQIGYIPKDIPAASFKTSGQKNSLAVNIVLVINMLFAILASTAFDSSYGFAAIVSAAVVGIAAVVMVVANIPFIFQKETVEAEQHTLLTKGEGAHFILTNRIWSWATWWVYGLGSAVIAVNIIIN